MAANEDDRGRERDRDACDAEKGQHDGSEPDRDHERQDERDERTRRESAPAQDASLVRVFAEPSPHGIQRVSGLKHFVTAP